MHYSFQNFLFKSYYVNGTYSAACTNRILNVMYVWWRFFTYFMCDMCIVRKYPELLQQFKYLLGYKDHGSLDPFAGLSGISSLLAAKDRTSEYSPEIGQY